MSDFEDRVRSALSSASESAPPADGLAPAARGRLRKRRRTTFVAVAAALVVAAIPTSLALARGGGGSDPTPPVATEPTSAPDEGWRWESYRDVSLQVPDDWGYGGGTDWCIGETLGSVTPQVTRPGGLVPSILCSPQYAYGVLFESSATVALAHPSGSVWQYGDEGVYPDAAWLSIVVEDETSVTVVTPDRAMTSRIVESVRTIDGVDGNGCRSRRDESSDGDPGERADQDSQMSICTYDDHGWLVQSERLSEQDTESAMAALSAAPIRQEQSPCSGTPVRYKTVVMGFGHELGSVSVVWESDCDGERGVFFSGVVRELTPDILYWALSPGWSGGVPDGVPCPTSSGNETRMTASVLQRTMARCGSCRYRGCAL